MLTWIRKLPASAILKPGFVDDARRAATPYVVDCRVLAGGQIGDRQFERQFSKCRNWCESQCPKDHEIEPIRDHQGRLTGRRFRFANAADATLFKTFFG